MKVTSRSLTIVGEPVPCGSYLLRIRLAEALALAFGRFRKGATFNLAAGEYLYVGSAMGRKGATSLARRLVRHATRSGNQPAHAIRHEMQGAFARHGLGQGDLRPRRGKTLFWHVDYLLDPPQVRLTHVLVLRSARRLEGELAALVAGQSYTSPPARGLGASDAPGETHVYRVTAEAGWWQRLLVEVSELV